MRAQQGGTRLGNITEDNLLLHSKTLHSLHQVGNQVRAALQNDIHLRPRGIYGFSFYGHLIPAADERASEHQSNHSKDDQDHQTFFHIHLNSVRFKTGYSLRDATLVWE